MKFCNRSRTVIPVVSLLLIFSIGGAALAQKSIAVVGSVTDPNVGPIPGAHISLYSFDRIFQTTSDSSGHFKFDAVPGGKYEFEVMAPGFKRHVVPNLDLADLMRAVTKDKPIEIPVGLEIAPAGSAYVVIPTIVEMALVGPCGPPNSSTYAPRKTADESALSGTVLDGYPKTPVVRATLRLVDNNGAQIAQQQTNERGEFQFRQTAPGRYHLLFQHPAYHDIQSSEFWIARENTTYVTLDPIPLGKIRVCQ